jgi:hypothetical protein
VRPARRLRIWPALLVLYFLSPGVAEVISGSTPPLLFIQPFGFIFVPLLYGSSAILIHEVVVRRRLGWGNVLLLGAAFGIFQEALVVQTWFTYLTTGSPSRDTGTYGALWGTNWYWAFNLSIYHAVISIATPLVLLDVFFPRRAHLPWLGRKGIAFFFAWLVIPCGLLAYAVATLQFAKQGYHGPPPGSYLACIGLLLIVIALGVFVRFPAPAPNDARRAPGPWAVRLSIFGLFIVFFALDFLLPSTHIPAIAASAIVAAVLAFGLWRVRSWSRRVGWNAHHKLALATGVVMFFALVWAPLVEFTGRQPARERGLTAFDLLVLLALALFARRLDRRMAAEHPSSPPAAPSLVEEGVGG